jgi:hypothetical protein
LFKFVSKNIFKKVINYFLKESIATVIAIMDYNFEKNSQYASLEQSKFFKGIFVTLIALRKLKNKNIAKCELTNLTYLLTINLDIRT